MFIKRDCGLVVARKKRMLHNRKCKYDTDVFEMQIHLEVERMQRLLLRCVYTET